MKAITCFLQHSMSDFMRAIATFLDPHFLYKIENIRPWKFVENFYEKNKKHSNLIINNVCYQNIRP